MLAVAVDGRGKVFAPSIAAGDGWLISLGRTLAKLEAPFRAPLRMRVERRQDLANMMGELLFSRAKRGKLC